MTKLRLGVIGAGHGRSPRTCRTSRKRRDEVEFVGVCRKGPELLEKIKDDWGFAMASEDYRDVIDAGMDICLVASPHGLHYEHAKAALESGAHVLCEKPFTVEPEHAWELVEIAERKNLHLLSATAGTTCRGCSEAKRLMDEHGIGEVEQSAVQMASVCRELLANLGDYPRRRAGVACPSRRPGPTRATAAATAQAQLSHALGVALWLTGLRGDVGVRADEVGARRAGRAPRRGRDRYDNGSIGTMSGGSCHLGAARQPPPARGARDRLRGPADDRPRARRVLALPRRRLRGAARARRRTPPLQLRRPAEHARRPRARQGRPNCSPGELGARTVEILDAAYRSARSGKLETIGR